MSKDTDNRHTSDAPAPSIKPLFGKTKKERVYQGLKQGIQSGAFPPGSYLPTARELAKEYRVSITPVYQAIEALVAESLVETLAGYGTRILEPGQAGTTLRRPLIEVLTTLKLVDDKPHFKHHLPAVQEQMIIHLRETSGLRISLATLDREDHEQSMLHFIAEGHHTRPTVLAFSEPEVFSDQVEQSLIALQKKGTAIVYRASRKLCPGFDRVQSAFDQGQADLTRHLLQSGHRELLRVAIDLNPFYEQQKQKGFLQAMQEAGISGGQAAEATWEIGPEILNSKPMDRVSHLIGRLTIELRKRKVTAIMAPDDPWVAPFRIALDYLNRSDITVVGYDDLWEEAMGGILNDFGDELKDRSAPVTMDTQLSAVGDAMAELIIDRALKKIPAEPAVRIVPQKLVTHTAGAAE